MVGWQIGLQMLCKGYASRPPLTVYSDASRPPLTVYSDASRPPLTVYSERYWWWVDRQGYKCCETLGISDRLLQVFLRKIACSTISFTQRCKLKTPFLPNPTCSTVLSAPCRPKMWNTCPGYQSAIPTSPPLRNVPPTNCWIPFSDS